MFERDPFRDPETGMRLIAAAAIVLTVLFAFLASR